MVSWFQAAVAAIAALFQPAPHPEATTLSAVVQTQVGSPEVLTQGLAAARARDTNLAQAYASSGPAVIG